jgi:hypothetical protein
MTETLLSVSNVLLFGRKVEDLKIVDPVRPVPVTGKIIDVIAATTKNIAALHGHDKTVDGEAIDAANKHVLVKNQSDPSQNGIYTSAGAAQDWVRHADADTADKYKAGIIVKVTGGRKNENTWWEVRKFRKIGSPIKFSKLGKVEDGNYKDPRHGPFVEERGGKEGDIEGQLKAEERCFARIYGFSYEGTYYDLPYPCLFLVHGDGLDVAEEANWHLMGAALRARGLGDPSLTGLAAADFQFAENLRVWSYDRFDYTIRMDVESGMFDQVLLEAFLGGGGPSASGARVSGARVSGARVSGARVSGARVSGARLSGGTASD